MQKLPVLKPRELLDFLKYLGFTVTSQRGSHIRLKSQAGQRTTVPFHSSNDIPKGTLMSVIQDLGITKEEFLKLYAMYKKKDKR
jgi:predicted RNA binding protein YcfA (HicA-like mRNA interferase family)